MKKAHFDKRVAIKALNRILEAELAGVVRYTHYSLMVYGYNRKPIVEWLREQAQDGLRHAEQAGEMITHMGARPSLKIGNLLDRERDDIGEILRESLVNETDAKNLYVDLLAIVTGQSVMLEEYARRMIAEEEAHAGEINKMLRRPGQAATLAAA